MASALVPELKKQRDKLDFSDQPSFLKNTFVADASFLTNYQKISKFIKDHQDLKKSDDFLTKNDLFYSQPKANTNTKPHPFELHLTSKNLNDVHANSKHFYPLHKDMQFTDFGEMNKEKSNANNLVIQQNWPNLNNSDRKPADMGQQASWPGFERKAADFNNFNSSWEKKPGDFLPEHTPEKNIYPVPIIKNEVFTDFIRSEQRLKQTQNDRLKQQIESLGGIEDTISSSLLSSIFHFILFLIF